MQAKIINALLDYSQKGAAFLQPLKIFYFLRLLLPAKLFIKPDIKLRRPIPAKVSLHSSCNQSAPLGLFIPIQLSASADSAQHIKSVIGLEGKAKANIIGLAVVENGVLQTACCSYNGDSAVSQGDHLRQSARLALARHQEHISACIDLLSQSGDIAAGEAYLVGITVVHFLEEILVLRFA